MYYAAKQPVAPVMSPHFEQFTSAVLDLALFFLPIGLVLLLSIWACSKMRSGVTRPHRSMDMVVVSRRSIVRSSPPNPVPEEVQKLVVRLKAAAERVKAPIDQYNLREICATIPTFYERHKRLGGDGTYTAQLEEKLKNLTDVVDGYLHIQDAPARYTFDGPGDQLYLGITKPKKRLRKISQAIQAYQDLLCTALRDDSKLEVATLDLKLGGLLVDGVRQKALTLKPLRLKAAKIAGNVYDKAKGRIGK